ncbi:MAG: hypothetical protein WDO73_12200 [Ignavibacteriota bacterium]
MLPAFKQAAGQRLPVAIEDRIVNPSYNSAIAGSVQLPYFAAMPNGGYLTNSSVESYIQTGAIGELANFYQYNGCQWPVQLLREPQHPRRQSVAEL